MGRKIITPQHFKLKLLLYQDLDEGRVTQLAAMHGFIEIVAELWVIST